MKGLKQTFKYGGEEKSITDLLKLPDVLNFLEREKELTYPSLREKVRKFLRKYGDSFKELVDEYNLENPPPQQRRQRDNLYGAQRKRHNLPVKNTRGKIIRERPPQPPRERRVGTINLNNENYTARQVLERFPRLRGFIR